MNITATAHPNPLHVELLLTALPVGTERVAATLIGDRIETVSAGVSGTSAILLDYTAPVGLAEYRVQAFNAAGTEVDTTTVAVLTPEPPSSHVWLSDPLDETSARLVALIKGGDQERTLTTPVEASHSLDGITTLSIGQSRRAPWTIAIKAHDPEEIGVLQSFFARASSILIRPGSEMMLPARITGGIPVASESLRLHAPVVNGRWLVTITPSSGPGIPAVISAWAWDDLTAMSVAEGWTWTSHPFDTWIDLERGPGSL